ncbi:MAG: DUF4389 domain-containing protein [Ilumatobacter sp.]|uniref:DUF4389 domain-containing protein n=1 Tax=Ilumatobacter sp. TaxID=1967498 RepID=UPI00262C8FC0|nr:DUF4389 domain-containing protein [Ilumatobacter sp.]MDJ0771789.1 DUF4389 domain-containing protein [Ilumatobacter sp.]
MKPGRVIALIVGCLMLIPGLVMVFGGGALGLGYAFARGDDGYFELELDRLQTPTAAIRSEDIDFFADPGSPDWLVDLIDADIRIEAEAVEDDALFIGIGPEDDVSRYLAGSAHDEVVELDRGKAPRYERRAGTAALDPPAEQTFWEMTGDGTDMASLDWEARSGRWVVVLMNADGSPGVAADVMIGAKSSAFLPITVFLLGMGLASLIVAIALIIVGTRRDEELDEARVATAPSAVAGIGESAATQEHPVALTAQLDPVLSRWLWLVKWFLAIPHFIALVFLWAAFVVTTIVAGVAILFTGRYPQGIYEFNLGVLRWTWRVDYYATTGGIGTDRYPPFSLKRHPDYPAVLDVAYPEQLSRGLVLVKWWLLAIPHYLIIAVLVGGAVGFWRDGPPFGLLGLLVLITGVILLVTGSYPRSMFDLIVGFNRWIFRVIAYAALMTDRYPPFRLDQGGIEPGSPLPPPPTPDGADTVGAPTEIRETANH